MSGNQSIDISINQLYNILDSFINEIIVLDINLFSYKITLIIVDNNRCKFRYNLKELMPYYNDWQNKAKSQMQTKFEEILIKLTNEYNVTLSVLEWNMIHLPVIPVMTNIFIYYWRFSALQNELNYLSHLPIKNVFIDMWYKDETFSSEYSDEILNFLRNLPYPVYMIALHSHIDKCNFYCKSVHELNHIGEAIEAACKPT